MKSLEDVIISIENCLIDPCQDCAIYVNDKCRKDEYTAYYLKEFQSKQEEIAALPDYYDLVNFWAESQANPPLTWDELKQMEGKPVWVEVDYHNPEATYKYWTIVKYFDSHEGGDIVFTGTGFYCKDLLGVDWRAYRKERE